MYENRCQDHIDENIKLEKVLEEIKKICIKYTERGWSLNPDKIEKIIDKTLEG